jgi:threonine dehydrogenase-like Zn-dependent dehydrogenase
VEYGYLAVDAVERGPAELRGRTVFCLHPHQTAFVVPAGAVVPVPDEVPPRRAVLAGTAETAVNALWDAPPLLGDRVTVVGAGMVGCCVARLLARFPGVDVELVDVDDGREDIAARLGVRFASPAGAAGLQRSLDLLHDPAFDALLTGSSPFAELPEVMARLADGRLSALCYTIDYDGV